LSQCTVSISGTATGASCVSYSNCNLTCCNKTYSGCGGTVSADCGPHGTALICNGDPCCFWAGRPSPPPPCKAKACADIAEGNCVGCGCTAGGTCVKKTCAQVAGIDNNPDVCSGCSTCGGDWQIDNNRGNTPWSITVTGILDPQAGGRVDISGGHTLAAGSWRKDTGGTVGFSTGGFLSLG